MTTFGAMEIGRTGVGFANHWIDSIAHNLANANTAVAPGEEPFRALRPVAMPLTGGPFAASGSGVHMAAQVRQGGDPTIVNSPGHPLADPNGNVSMPVMDTSGQMVDLMIAQRHYQANMRTVQSAREAYQSALRLGSQ
jgi:flagellar basal-body rod protein FlgC